MKTKRLMAVGSITVIVIAGWLAFSTLTRSHPELVLKGYASSETNAGLVAKLELRNATSTALWLYYSGTEYPLRPVFLERPIGVPAISTNGMGPVYSVHAGHFFMRGVQVPPGESISLDFLLRPGEPAKQVGTSFYLGPYSDGNDFLNHLNTPLSDSRVSWKDTVAFYWRRLRKGFKAPQRHEIWCADLLSFDAAKANPSPQ